MNARELFIQNQLIDQIRAKKPRARKIVNSYARGFILKYGLVLNSQDPVKRSTAATATSTGGLFGKRSSEIDLNIIKADLVEELAAFYGVPLKDTDALWPLVGRYHEKLSAYAELRHTSSGRKVGNYQRVQEKKAQTPFVVYAFAPPIWSSVYATWTFADQFAVFRELRKLGEDAIACFTEAAICIVQS